MKIHIAFAALFISAVQICHAATVEVDKYFEGTTQTQEVIAPNKVTAVPIGQLRSGDRFAIQVVAANKIYNDITACVANEQEVSAYARGSQCRGKVRSPTPLTMQDQAPADGKYFLILDNSYANLITKTLAVKISYRKSLSDEEVGKLKSAFGKVQSMISFTFEASDFNVNVRPCGMSNAFSNRQTADITICSEFMHELASQGNLGAMIPIVLHEYGHSLLNKWGEPGSSEEDMADQFATVMLLREGDNGRRVLLDWVNYWQRRDSRAEAQYQLERGDTHSLSIQRARNIQQSINLPDDLTRRWNKMLYRHMTRNALNQIIAKPSKTDDIDLANEALRSK